MMKIYNANIVLRDKIIHGYIEINDGKITSLKEGDIAVQKEGDLDTKGSYILPGFIDLHTNGIAGFDVTNGVYNSDDDNFSLEEEEYKAALEKALKAYTKTGVTTAYITSITAPVEQLLSSFKNINSWCKENKDNPLRNILGGIFIEGTFLKMDDFKGAHNSKYFCQPTIEIFKQLQTASGGLIKIVNIVPEWGSKALDLIDQLTENNIVCAAGHTGATGQEYLEAISHGTKLAIHFLNGPVSTSYKPFNNMGVIENVLRSPSVFAEIIMDSFHADKAYVLDTIKRKGFDKTIVVTDSMFTAGTKNISNFTFGGIKGEISSDGMYMFIKERPNALFGSMLTMDHAFSNVLNWLTSDIEGVWNARHSAMEFEEALIVTSQMCSGNPASLMSIHNSKGVIEVGKDADLIITQIVHEDNYYKLIISHVLSNGVIMV